MILYHYTPEHALDMIKEHGFNHFGIAWMTSSPEGENTAMVMRGLQGRLVIDKQDHMRSFTEDKEEMYDVFSGFMIVEMIDHISDTSKWYYSEEGIPRKNIIDYEVYVNDKWISYEDHKKSTNNLDG